MTNRFPRRALACTLLATTCLASPAVAQTVTSPTFRQVDANGVDLVQGDLVTSFTEGSIGSGEGELKLLRRLGSGSSGGNSPWDNILLQYIPGNGTFVDFGVRHDKFPGAETRGATLSGGGASYQYHLADGTIVAFVNGDPDYSSDSTNLCRDGSTDMCSLYPSSITSPDGGTITFDYEYWSHCFTQTPPGQPRSPDDPVHCDYVPRLKSVANSDGYKIVSVIRMLGPEVSTIRRQAGFNAVARASSTMCTARPRRRRRSAMPIRRAASPTSPTWPETSGA